MAMARLPVFVCSRCGGATALPKCLLCGCEFETEDGSYQLTRDPASNLDSDKGITYIGYDRIGTYFHGKDWASEPCSASGASIKFWPWVMRP